jgi:3-oxoacyl-[acyl-carrier protein] reductase
MDAGNRKLTGKVAVITGAGRGIGRALAIGFAEAGAEVGCIARGIKGIDGTVKDIEMVGGRGLAVPADVTDLPGLKNAFEHIHQQLGTPQILIINAGGPLERNRVEDSDPQKWMDTLKLNLGGAYLTIKAALPYMREKGGSIISMGSGRGHRPKAGTSGYSCAKAGLWMLTRILAEELAEYHITINELIPGPVMTEGFREALNGVDLASAFPETEFIKEPEDVVPLAIFLASQGPNGPTGQCFSLMRRDGL